MKLLETLEKQLNGNRQSAANREERIANAEVEWTDCSTSIWANSKMEDLLQTKIEILKNGGLAEFKELQFIDGTPTNAKLVETQWGYKYLVIHSNRHREFVDPNVKPKTLEKKGYKIAMVLKPAWAKLAGGGKGWSGMNNVGTQIYESNVNYIDYDTEKEAEFASLKIQNGVAL